jgi:molybdate transport system substrate-binding protein
MLRLLVAMGLALAVSGRVDAQERLTVFAAASLKNAPDVGETATISYAASSALAKQIEEGAPADIFVSADLDWMAYLSGKGLVRKATETRLLGNRIALIAPATSPATIRIATDFDLAGLLGDGRLAMANVQSVPAGKYGKEALEKLGVWTSVKGRVAQAENVRAALALVSTGEAPLGIVYQTDAAADPRVKVIGTFPEDSHAPIVYPVAQTAESSDEQAPAFLECLQSAKARTLFEKQGFAVLVEPESN